jgi:hypothetical protein
VAQNEDGTYRIDFTGEGGTVTMDLSRPLDFSHHHEIAFTATGDPRGLHPVLMQGASNALSFGTSLYAAGTFDHTLTFSAPNGKLQIKNNAMSPAFSLSAVSVIDLDA